MDNTTRKQLIIDELLIMQTQAGNRKAFEKLIERNHKRFYRYAWHLIGNEDGAWEVLQESYLAIVKSIMRLADPGSFRAWSYRIVSNKAADYIRNKGKTRKISQLSDDNLPEVNKTHTNEKTDNNSERIIRAIATLPDIQRQILSLYYLEEFTIRQIAGILGKPPGTVKSRLHNARLKLKDIVTRTNSETSDQ